MSGAATIGAATSELDTPAMLVDLELAQTNVARLMAALSGTSVSVRPHLKTVKSPEFARLLLAAGARGVCVAKLSEAEVMAGAGIEDILITTELGTGPKLERLVALVREHPAVKLVLDSVAGADALEAALRTAGLSLEGLARCRRRAGPHGGAAGRAGAGAGAAHRRAFAAAAARATGL
ncbi:MAG TPA: alanine racemase [Polyangiaceae bacterium]|nr:alanine racemase [Polyangiaceae bacterium]